MKGRIFKVFVIVVLLIFPVSCLAYARGAKEEVEPGVKKVKILGAVLTMDHIIQQEIGKAMHWPFEGYEIDISVQDPKADAAQEVTIIETYLTKGIDAIYFYPVDSVALAPVVKEAKEKGVYVVTYGNHVEGEDAFVG